MGNVVGYDSFSSSTYEYSPDVGVTDVPTPPKRTGNGTESAAERGFQRAAVGLVLGLICTTTVTGNLLVLLAVCVTHSLRTTTHFFVANLAVADLLLGAAVLPFSASLELLDDRWAFGAVFCDVWAALDVLCCTASILSLCVISVDRYVGVTRPLRHSVIVSDVRAGGTILGVWTLSIAISVAPLFGWKEEAPTGVCSVTKQTGYVFFSASVSFYAPLAVILVVYFRVYREALAQSRFLATGVKVDESGNGDVTTLRIHTGNRKTMTSSPTALIDARRGSHHRSGPDYGLRRRSEGCRRSAQQSKETLMKKIAKFNREKKAAKTLGIVVGVFVLCWFPFFFLLPLEAVCSRCAAPKWLFKVIFWLGYCNSTMNPIIYACSSREFQKAFLHILRCRWMRPSSDRRQRHPNPTGCTTHSLPSTSSSALARSSSSSGGDNTRRNSYALSKLSRQRKTMAHETKIIAANRPSSALRHHARDDPTGGRDREDSTRRRHDQEDPISEDEPAIHELSTEED